MKKSLFILLILCLLSGCSLFRKVVYVPVEVKSDSIYVEKIVEHKDTVSIEIPVEKLVFSAPVDSSYLETSVAYSTAVIDSSGLLHHILENKKGVLQKEIVYKDSIIEITKMKEVPVIKEVEKQVKYVPGFYKWCTRLFLGLFVIFIVLVVLKIKNII